MRHLGTKTSFVSKAAFLFFNFMLLSLTWTEVVLNGLLIDNWKTEKNVVGRGYGQIENWRDIGQSWIPSASIVHNLAEIWTRDVWNTELEHCSYTHPHAETATLKQVYDIYIIQTPKKWRWVLSRSSLDASLLPPRFIPVHIG